MGLDPKFNRDIRTVIEDFEDAYSLMAEQLLEFLSVVSNRVADGSPDVKNPLEPVFLVENHFLETIETILGSLDRIDLTLKPYKEYNNRKLYRLEIQRRV